MKKFGFNPDTIQLEIKYPIELFPSIQHKPGVTWHE